MQKNPTDLGHVIAAGLATLLRAEFPTVRIEAHKQLHGDLMRQVRGLSGLVVAEYRLQKSREKAEICLKVEKTQCEMFVRFSGIGGKRPFFPQPNQTIHSMKPLESVDIQHPNSMNTLLAACRNIIISISQA